MDGSLNGHMSGQMNGLMDGTMDKKQDEWTDGWMGGHPDGGWVDGWVLGWKVHGWTSEWMDRWLSRRMHRWVDLHVLLCAISTAVPAPPLEEPPPRPRLGGLTVSKVTPSSIQLEWSVLEGTFDSFTVHYRDGQGQPQALAVDGGSRTVTVSGLSPSRRYKINLYGVWGRKRIGLISTDAVTGEGAVGPVYVLCGHWVWSKSGGWTGPLTSRDMGRASGP